MMCFGRRIGKRVRCNRIKSIRARRLLTGASAPMPLRIGIEDSLAVQALDRKVSTLNEQES